MEFGLRRAQGPDAGIYGASAAMIGGCIGTSNVLAGQLFDVPVKGTHAHSWIMSFPDEYTAFKTYAKLYPDACILLVDTYDTLKIRRAHMPSAFSRKCGKPAIPLKFYGIRLDSGDLAYLSKKARKMLDDAGFPDAIISASSDLDEIPDRQPEGPGRSHHLLGCGHEPDHLQGLPRLRRCIQAGCHPDQRDGEFIPKIKLSENTEKVTNPGNKKIIRIYEKDSHKIKADLITLVEETFDPEQDLTIFDPIETWKKTTLKGGTYEMREIMVPVFKDGVCVYESPAVMDIRQYAIEEQNTLWDESRRLINPHQVYVDLSDKLYAMKKQLIQDYSMKIHK